MSLAFALRSDAGPVAAAQTLGPDDRSAIWTPTDGWPVGPITLVQVGGVEDLAANTAERLFEVQPDTAPLDLEPFVVTFEAGHKR